MGTELPPGFQAYTEFLAHTQTEPPTRPDPGHEPTIVCSADGVHRGERWHGRGELLVRPDAVGFSPFAADGRPVLGELVHAASKLRVTNAGLRTFVFLAGSGFALRLAVPRSARRRLRDALGRTSLSVREETVWRAPRAPTRASE